MQITKNGKLYCPPPRDGSNFKELFRSQVAAGAGRLVDEDGFTSGPWTADLLAGAISEIQINKKGIDLRTVQLWFQDNDKGVSTDNIRWLARVFGCDDPEATGAWQLELSAAQARLKSGRRKLKQAGSEQAVLLHDVPAIANRKSVSEPKRRFSLARKSEAIFSRGSPLDLPASVFAGAVALGFVSYLTGVHNASYERADGLIKQVGFIWAPNWTILFMVFMPLFFAFAVELLVFWKSEGRSRLLTDDDDGWARSVEASSYTYWAVLLICLPVAGLFQWIGVRLMPLIEGVDHTATDWGSLAVLHPEIISVPEAIMFTGAAYLYMCLCFYLFFVGLILLYTMAQDLWKIEGKSYPGPHEDYQREVNEVGLRVMRGIFRCTVLGILIPICMKLQSFYLTSNAENIVAWLFVDMSSVLMNGRDDVSAGIEYSMPTHYSSLIIALATCVVFLYGFIRLGVGSPFHVPLGKMAVVVVLLASSYLLIGAFAGFSILLMVGVLTAIYGLFDPAFRLGGGRAVEPEDNQIVL